MGSLQAQEALRLIQSGQVRVSPGCTDIKVAEQGDYFYKRVATMAVSELSVICLNSCPSS